MKSSTFNYNLLSLYLFFVFAFTIAIGFRPVYVGTDTLHYITHHNELLTKVISNTYFEYLFNFIMKVGVYFQLSYPFFFMMIAFLTSITTLLLVKELYEFLDERFSYERIFLALLFFYLISPFFFLLEVNVIRQGVAIGILFLVYFLLLKRSWIMGILLAAVALGFHKTVIFYLVTIPLLFCLNYFSIMCLGIMLAVFYVMKINQYILQYIPMIYNKIINYGILSNYKRGVRWDFVLFTIGLGLFFHFASKYFLEKEEQDKFLPLLSIYWLSALPFFLLGFGPYSDRYLLPCWLWLSVLATVFSLFFIKRFNISILYYIVLFLLSFCYFIFKAQGIII